MLFCEMALGLLCAAQTTDFVFSEHTVLQPTAEAAMPVAQALQDGLMRISGSQLNLAIAKTTESKSVIELMLNPLDHEIAKTGAFLIDVMTNKVVIAGSDQAGLANGAARLLRLVNQKPDDGDPSESDKRFRWSVPKLEFVDMPEAEWRGIMIDVARFPHTIADVREVVELAWLTGLNRVHLHLSDDQYFTFPSTAYPELGSVGRNGERLHFTRQELVDLVAFAQARGIVLVPEMDMPAHAGVMVRARPDLFGTIDAKTGKPRSTGVVNMASERAYQALDVLIGEVCDVFIHSPYIHLGADEVSAGHLRTLPEYDEYVQKHFLPRAIKGDVGELYCHFVGRVCEMVRKRGRRPVIWEGFHGTGTEAAPIPKDVLVMAWNLTFQSPQALVDNGYEIVNCGWDPLYVVPSQCWVPSLQRALDWDVFHLRQRLGGPEFRLDPSAAVLGAQMCVWEQRPDAILGASYEILAAVSSRMWNADEDLSVDSFRSRRGSLDRVVQRMLRPNLAEAIVTAKQKSNAYPVPDKDLAYHWRAAWPIPLGTGEVLDVDQIGVRAKGNFAGTGNARIKEVNRELFARVAELGHIDTRIPALPEAGLEWLPRRQWRPYSLELTGKLQLPSDGEYTFFVRANDGAAELTLGGTEVAVSRGNREAHGRSDLQAGVYDFRIRFHFEYVQNELNIKLQGPGMASPLSFDDFVVRGKSTTPTLTALEFIDPRAQLFRSMATGKPIVSSAGHQGNMTAKGAVDGIIGNESGWHCGESPATLTIDLEAVQTLQRAKFYFYNDGYRHYQYQLELSVDGEKWQQAIDASANVEASSSSGVEHKFPPTQARYARLIMLRNSANEGVHVNEILLFDN